MTYNLVDPLINHMRFQITPKGVGLSNLIDSLSVIEDGHPYRMSVVCMWFARTGKNYIGKFVNWGDYGAAYTTLIREPERMIMQTRRDVASALRDEFRG